MLTIKKLNVVLIVTLSTALLGCATGSGPYAQDQTATRAQATAAGAMLGGILGYVLGDKEVKDAALGAGLGAGAGYLIGNEVAKRKQLYITLEDRIKGETEHTAQLTKEVRRTNQRLRDDIAVYDREIKQLARQVEQGYASRVELRKQKEKLAARQSEVKMALDSVNREIEVETQLLKEARRERTGESIKLKEWENEIALLERERDELSRYMGELAAMGSALAI